MAGLFEGRALRLHECQVLLPILVQLLVEGCLLVDHRVESIQLVLDRGDLPLTLGRSLREAIGSPVRLLPRVQRLASDLGVAFCDGPHELEPVRELADALCAQQTVDLRSGPEVGLHGPIREALLRRREPVVPRTLAGFRDSASFRSVRESRYFASLYCSASTSKSC